MKLKEDENFWEYYRFTGDFFAADIKQDAKDKFGDYLEAEIFAVLRESEEVENFRYGWLVRKANGLPYLICFFEQMDYMLLLTAKVELLKP
ncbi:MAG TPA: hypothetical protein VMV49_13245 [Candidatus Deferrimicrobium sp.]|nr:hypothetical protein [Candidatus Deferrimicrobium sp.]